MAFVLDASVTLAWHFPDELDAAARALAARAARDGVHVPAHWAAEVANGLLTGQRHERTTGDAIAEFIERLAVLSIDVDHIEPAQIFARILPLAKTHQLALYDALYLELAERLKLPLATHDAALAKAAVGIGVAVIGDRT